MTIAKLSGNNDGIVVYLRTGSKSGRTKSRDEIDKRVILKGNLELLDQILKSNQSSRVKYLHITLSFLEDSVTTQILNETLELYEKLIFSAFRKDEYYLYAEAHMPIEKTYVDEKGQTRHRKPHIHIVVPNINLKTRAAANPYGLYKYNKKFFNAIQEYINDKTGTISPSQRKRNNFVGKSNIFERVKGDSFKDEIREFKTKLLNSIIENNISSVEEFRILLTKIGEHKTRNLGKTNYYEAVKPLASAQFINLRNYYFSKDFFELSQEEKKKALQPRSEHDFFSLGTPRETSKEVHQLLDEWINLRSRQIKYINGNATEQYKRMNDREKICFLDELERQHFLKIDSPANDGGARPTLDDLKAFIQTTLPTPSPMRSVLQPTDSFLNQLVRDRDDRAWVRTPEVDALVRELNTTIDIDFMLSDLVYSYGLVREKYQISGEEGPGEAPIDRQRIRCGNHNLNVGDFLTREVNMRWPDAFAYMQSIFQKQKTHIPNRNLNCGRPHPVLWSRSREQLAQTKNELNGEYKQFVMSLRAAIEDEKSIAALQRSYDRFLLFQIKMPSYIREIFLALVDSDYTDRRNILRNSLLIRLKKASSLKLQFSSWSGYLYFLSKNASISAACLAELRNHAPAHTKNPNALCFHGQAESAINDGAVVKDFKLERRVSEIGDVQYEKHGAWLARDEGTQIVVNSSAGTFAIRVAIALSEKKWTTYSVGGPKDLSVIAKALAVTSTSPSERSRGSTDNQKAPNLTRELS